MYKSLKVIITPIISFFFVILCFVLVTMNYLDFSFVYTMLSLYILNWISIWIVFLSKRRSEVRLSWVFVISVFPVIGMLAFFFYGREYKYKKKNRKYSIYNNTKIKYEDSQLVNKYLEFIKKNTPNFYEVFKLSYNSSLRAIYKDSEIKILDVEEHWISLIRDLMSAKKYILMTYFIFAKGKSVDLLCNLFEQKIKAGVKIYFLYDHVGTYFQNMEKIFKKLKKMGVKVHRFEKFMLPFIKGTVNYRNHRKDIIIDGKIGYTGGINMGDKYLNFSVKFGKINDFQCRISGNVVKSLELIFMNDWYFTTNQEINNIENNFYPMPDENYDNPNFIQIVDSGPTKSFSIHKNILLKLIDSAQKRIWMSTPYFIPSEDLINALIIAAKLGKDVRILIPGRTDKLFILSLTKLYASELLKYGIKIYTMNNVFNHAKIFLFDDEISINSTTNLDQRSFFVDYQTMVINYNRKINQLFSEKLEECFRLSTLLSINEINNWNFNYKLLIKILRLASPIL